MAMPTMASDTLMPKYLQCFQQPHGKNYAFNTLLIDMTQVIRGLGLLVYYRTTHKKKNLDCAIKTIQDQLKKFEACLLQEERNALTALKNRFNVSDEIWNACLTDIQELKDIYKNAMGQPCAEAQFDKNVPPHLADTITAILLKNNIDPQSISLQMAKEPKASTLMHVRSIIDINIDPKDNKLIIVKHYLPPILEIFPAIKKQLNNRQKITALCAHEVQHIVQHHVLTQVILETYLDHYYAIDGKTLVAAPEFQKFIQVREAHAELLSAIKDPEIAHCLSYYRANTYYPNYLYEDHYYNLSNVDMLWKIDAWLTWCQQFTIANTKDDIITKMHNLAGSFKQLIS
jgi:hypothetical protein